MLMLAALLLQTVSQQAVAQCRDPYAHNLDRAQAAACLRRAVADCPHPNAQNLGRSEEAACAGRAFLEEDAALNATWRTTLATLRQRDRDGGYPTDDAEAGATQLIAAQRAWLTFREAECATEAEANRGGNLANMVEEDCRTRLTHERTRQLRALTAGE